MTRAKCLHCGAEFERKRRFHKYCSAGCGREYRESKKNKKPHGRPAVITEDKKMEIIAVLSTGGSRNMAADYVSVGRTTLHDLIERDDDFSDQVKKAESESKFQHIKNISNAADGGAWQASAWYLERKEPGEFGRNKIEQKEPGEKKTIEIVIINGKRDAS